MVSVPEVALSVPEAALPVVALMASATLMIVLRRVALELHRAAFVAFLMI